MKQLFFTFLTLACLGSLNSCTKGSDEDIDTNQKELSLTNLNINLDGLRFGEFPETLFEFSSSSELSSNLQTSFIDFLNEIDEIVENNKSVDHVLYEVTFEHNKAIIKSLYFLNTEEETVIDVFGTGERFNWGSITGNLITQCSDGKNDEGSCSSKICLAEKVEAILKDKSYDGACVDLQFSRNQSNVRICSKSKKC